MLTMEVDEFVQNVAALALTGMAEYLFAGNDLVQDTCEATGHFHSRPSRVFSLRFPNRIQSAKGATGRPLHRERAFQGAERPTVGI